MKAATKPVLGPFCERCGQRFAQWTCTECERDVCERCVAPVSADLDTAEAMCKDCHKR